MMRRKKWKAVFLAGVMSTVMCAGAVVQAAETKQSETTQNSGTTEDAASKVPGVKAQVTKVLNVAEGTEVPDVTFSFEAKPKTEDAADVTISDISFDKESEKGNLDQGVYHVAGTGAMEFAEFDHAGEYVYEVSEKTGNADGVTYSTEKYDLHVYVANKGKDELYIKALTATNSNGKKVTDLKFVNTYVNNNASLSITKKTTGELADKTKDFTFKIIFTKAATSDQTVYEGKIGSEAVRCEAGKETEFQLHDGETLVFEKLPAGTRYVVEEVGQKDNYTPSVVVKENGTMFEKSVRNEADSLATADSGKTSLVGEKENSAVFTNPYQDHPITGLFMNNYPIFLLGAASVCAVVLLAVVSRRRFYR